MNNIKLRIDDLEVMGVVKERSQSGQRWFLLVDLDLKCILSPSPPTPPVDVEVLGVWKRAQISGIPTPPEFRRISLMVDI